MADGGIKDGASVLMRAAPGTPACLRSLGRRGIDTVVFSHRENAPSFYSRYCNEAVLVPKAADDLRGYTDALLSLAERVDIGTIIPMDEDDVFVLSKHRAAFAEFVTPLWPRFETLRVVHDRMQLVEVAEDAGVPVPGTWLLDDVEEWDRELIVKTRYSLLTADYVDSVPLNVSRRPESVTYHPPGGEPDRASIRAEMAHDPIVQEYVPGDEYALWALYYRGDAVATCLKRQVRGQSYAGGTSVYRETVRDDDLEKTGRALLDHLEWHGLASVQFKRDERTGEFTLLEVNPRAWISLSCAVRAGIDFPYYYWQLSGGEDVRRDHIYESGVGTHRLGGELIYLASVVTEENPIVDRPPILPSVWTVASSILNQPSFDYLALSDQGPFLGDIYEKARDSQVAGSLLA